MDFVEGRIFWDPTLPMLPPAERAAVWDDFNRVIALLHARPIAQAAWQQVESL